MILVLTGPPSMGVLEAEVNESIRTAPGRWRSAQRSSLCVVQTQDFHSRSGANAEPWQVGLHCRDQHIVLF